LLFKAITKENTSYIQLTYLYKCPVSQNDGSSITKSRNNRSVSARECVAAAARGDAGRYSPPGRVHARREDEQE